MLIREHCQQCGARRAVLFYATSRTRYLKCADCGVLYVERPTADVPEPDC